MAEGLVPDGVVDDRDIRDIRPEDVAGYDRCHFFAGILGWELALQWAGWPEDLPVWSASLPCTPFSVAGKGLGEEDERHLWPCFRELVEECRPLYIMGEQVSSKAGRAWFSGVRTDLESLGYWAEAFGLPAACVGKDHIRQRLFWMAHSENGKDRTYGRKPQAYDEPQLEVRGCGLFSSILCRDGEYRRISPKPESFPLAPRLPRSMGQLLPEHERLAEMVGLSKQNLKEAKSNRNERLSGYGNAIVPELAAEFLRSYLGVIGIK